MTKLRSDNMSIVLNEQEKQDMANGKSWKDILQARGMEVKSQPKPVEVSQEQAKADELKVVKKEHKQAVEQYKHHRDMMKKWNKVRHDTQEKVKKLEAGNETGQQN